MRIPVLTRALLLYRYRRLQEARRAARAAGHQGAMYPWQSGSDGRKEKIPAAYFNPMSGRWIPDYSFRQRHRFSDRLQYLAISKRPTIENSFTPMAPR